MRTDRQGVARETKGRRGLMFKARVTAGLLALAYSQVAMGQTQSGPPATDAPASGERDGDVIVVTASRIKRSGFDAPTPTTIFGGADLAKTGVTNIGQIANKIPTFAASSTPSSSVLSSDTGRGQFLDLRGLGAQRTLTLVNNKRFVPTTTGGLVDTNVVPSLLIDRIEIVTGGASAAWGSDAVAGVVNIIFKKDLQGLLGEIQGGESTHGDSRELKGSLAYGTQFAGGNGHFVISGEYERNSGVRYQSKRDWGAKDWGIIGDPDHVPGDALPAQLVVSNTRLIFPEGGLILSGSLFGAQFLPGGVPAAFDIGRWDFQGLNKQGGDGVNWGSTAALQLPLRRHSVYARTSYDIDPSWTFSLEGSYAESKTINRNLVQPFDLGSLFINADNVFLPAAIQSQLAANGEPGFGFGRLDTDFGFIQSIDNNRTFRGVAGIDGKLGGDWTVNAYYEFGRTIHDNSSPNNRIEANYAKAVDAVASPTTGQPICRSTLTDPTDGCVPINLFGYGSPSSASLDYIHGTQRQHTVLTENAAAASIQGTLFKNWAGPVSIAAGAEYRREQARGTVDALSATDAFIIGNPKSINGSYNVKEAFVETVVPLLSKVPFAKSFDFNGAVRVTDYSLSGTVVTWKAGLSWSVSDELRFRTTRSRDIRAPNIQELFATPSLGFAQVNDPENNDISVLIQTPGFPNSALKPEKADTLTAGVVIEPHWLHGLRLSVDYYDIRLKGAIATLSAQDVVDRCASGNTALCAFVGRDAGGALQTVSLGQLNLNRLTTRGIDSEIDYTTSIGDVGLNLRALATYVDKLAINDGTSVVDRAGDVGVFGSESSIANGLPHWRGNASATITSGPLLFYVAGRLVGGGRRDSTLAPLDIDRQKVKGRAYMDMSIQYDLKTGAEHSLQLFATMNNVFDKDPPIVPSTFIVSLATNPVLYDVVGRTFSVGARFKY
ncbi:MAG TPA: TonB-dependent receptor [Sphingobium sp.]